MKRIIILEGCDNIGKTLLAEQLKKKFCTFEPTIKHFGPPTKKGKAALTEQLSLLRAECTAIVEQEGVEIWDRSVLGECVYGPMYRAEQYDHDEYRQALGKWLNTVKSQILLVILYTNGDMYQRFGIARKNDETKLYQSFGEAPKIATAFVDLATRLSCKNTVFVNCENYTTFDQRNKYVSDRVKAFLARTTYHHQQIDDYSHSFFGHGKMIWKEGKGFLKWKYQCGTYNEGDCSIGNEHHEFARYGQQYDRPTSACGAIRHVRYVFVGEAPGYNGCGHLGIPFYGDASGSLMQTTLDRLGILPTQYYMTNTVKCCPKNNKLGLHVSNDNRKDLECVDRLNDELDRVLDYNPKAKIIAIGKVAGFELARKGYHHVVAYHPAFYLYQGTPDQFYHDMKKLLKGVAE